MTKISFPYAGIILLVGPSNSGKTTMLKRLIAENKILASEVISSDQFRVLVSDIEYINWNERSKDEADALFDEYHRISNEAFEAMDFLLGKRCRLNKLTIIDATHLKEEDRERYIRFGKKYHVPVVAMVLNVAEKELIGRDTLRDFPRGKNRIKQQYQHFKRTLRSTYPSFISSSMNSS